MVHCVYRAHARTRAWVRARAYFRQIFSGKFLENSPEILRRPGRHFVAMAGWTPRGAGIESRVASGLGGVLIGCAPLLGGVVYIYFPFSRSSGNAAHSACPLRQECAETYRSIAPPFEAWRGFNKHGLHF